MQEYRKLTSWQHAFDLAQEVYLCTKAFPPQEMYGLQAQLRRASVSVMSNIAEGKGRLSRREYAHFVGNARGSLMEVEAQILMAARLGYIDGVRCDSMLVRTETLARMLNALIAYLRRSDNGGAPNTQHRIPRT